MTEKSPYLERFNRTTALLDTSEREWHDSLRRANWESFKEGYKEERHNSRDRFILIDEGIELMAKGYKPVSLYGYEKGKLAGKARSLMDIGFKSGRLRWALTGALLYEKLGYRNRESVKRKVIGAYEKNVEGRPHLRLDEKDIVELKQFLERNIRAEK